LSFWPRLGTIWEQLDAQQRSGKLPDVLGRGESARHGHFKILDDPSMDRAPESRRVVQAYGSVRVAGNVHRPRANWPAQHVRGGKAPLQALLWGNRGCVPLPTAYATSS
jgi:hypothetical protein